MHELNFSIFLPMDIRWHDHSKKKGIWVDPLFKKIRLLEYTNCWYPHDFCLCVHANTALYNARHKLHVFQMPDLNGSVKALEFRETGGSPKPFQNPQPNFQRGMLSDITLIVHVDSKRLKVMSRENFYWLCM